MLDFVENKKLYKVKFVGTFVQLGQSFYWRNYKNNLWI